MILFASLTFATGLVLVYVVIGRPYLKTVPGLRKFFIWIEPYEIALWRKSETILFSRALILGGLIPPLLEELEKLNVYGVADLIPERYRGWWTLSFTVIGIINELNRRRTTKPLELVAVPDQGVSPQVEKAIVAAETAKDKAVVAVEVDAMVKKTGATSD